MSDALQGVNPAIASASVLAILCFLLSLRAFVTGRRRGPPLALAGVGVAGVATIYSHDVMALPQICGALIIGGIGGPLIARRVPVRKLPALLAGLLGQTGLAALLIGAAAWRNPHSFGLLNKFNDLIMPTAAGTMGLTIALGALVVAASFTILWRRTGGGTGMSGVFAAALLPVTAMAVLSFAKAPAMGTLCACAGVALLAGRFLAKWALQSGEGPALALIGGLAGWSVAAAAFLLENMTMAVAGGLAGAAGSLFALRLCGGAGRKGLADEGCRP